MIILKPSDLRYRYPRDVANRSNPKFRGKPDPQPFNRHDLYEVLPVLSAAMDALDSRDERVLHLLEDILNQNMPHFLDTREEVFDFLVGMARERLGMN